MILPSSPSPLKFLADVTHFLTSLVQSRSPVPEIAESSEQGTQYLTPNLGYLLGMLHPCVSISGQSHHHGGSTMEPTYASVIVS